MTITFDAPVDPATKARWEAALPKHAEKWPVGKVGGVMLNHQTYYLQRTGLETLRLTVDKESLTTAPDTNDPLAALYHDLWAILFNARDKTPEEQQRALAEVEARLPQQCCLNGHREWMRRNPPVFGEGFFAFCVAMKNDVRRRQGKSEMTVDEARALYA